jgi:hypothetical protein
VVDIDSNVSAVLDKVNHALTILSRGLDDDKEATGDIVDLSDTGT